MTTRERLEDRLKVLEGLEVQARGGTSSVSPPLSADPTTELNTAARLLLTYLPEDTQRLITEAIDTMAMDAWKVVLGYVMRVAEQQGLFSPYIMSQWEAGLRPNAPRPCGTCSQPFASKFPQARYCCNPCACGKLAEFGHAEDCPTRAVVLA